MDAQLSPNLARRFIEAGYDATHVCDVGMLSESDRGIWGKATELGAVVVTKDEDFLALSKRDKTGPQVIWIRLGNASNDALWAGLSGVLPDILKALAEGERVVEVRKA